MEENKKNVETCQFFVVRKKRYCKMNVAKGKAFCGEHDKSEESDSRRIPCPLDPKHTVYTNKLEKHLKICNARPKNDLPKYIKPGINLNSSLEETGNNDLDQEKFTLQDVSADELNAAIDKIQLIYKKFVEGKIEKLEFQHDVLKEELSNPDYGQSTLKHLIQTSAILGILNHFEFLKPNTCYVEYGAGKGGVAYWLAKSIENFDNSKVFLLDKASHRHKKDNKIENRDLVKRILCDIADFDQKNIEDVDDCNQIIGCSKHLCGAATDLTIRCILNGNENKNLKTNGFLIALCCHHKCSWKEFVGLQFFIENGIDEKLFRIFTKIVSWSICGTGMSREKRKELDTKDKNKEQNSNHKLDRKTKEEIGWKCKRIIDYARVQFLNKTQQYKAELKFYCDSSITLENVCIVAKYVINS